MGTWSISHWWVRYRVINPPFLAVTPQGPLISWVQTAALGIDGEREEEGIKDRVH